MEKIIEDAEKIISNSLNNEELQEEASSIVQPLYDEYVEELQARWDECIGELEYILEQLKPLKKRMDALGVIPDDLNGDSLASREILELLDTALEFVPDEPFIEPEVFGHNDEKSR